MARIRINQVVGESCAGLMVLVVAGAGLLADPSAAPQPLGKQADLPPTVRPIRTDLYGDPLPPGAVARFGSWRLRHRGPLSCLAVSPDGKVIASGGNADHTLRLWESASGRQLLRVALDGVASVAFSPDGKWVASAGGNSGIHLWEVATGRLVRRFGPHTARTLAFAPDGTTLSSGGDYDKVISLWDATTGKVVRRLEGHTAGVAAVRFAARGKTLVTVGNDKTVRLWDPDTDKELRRLEGHRGYIYGLAIAPDGKTVYAANSGSGDVSVIDARTNRVVRTIPTGRFPSGVAVTPDGASLYVTNELSGVTVINAGNGTVAARLREPSPFSVAMSPNGDRAYVTSLGPGRVTAIDTATHRVSSTVSVGPYGTDPFTVRATDDALYVANQGANTLSIIDRSTFRAAATIATGNSPYGIAVVQRGPTNG